MQLSDLTWETIHAYAAGIESVALVVSAFTDTREAARACSHAALHVHHRWLRPAFKATSGLLRSKPMSIIPGAFMAEAQLSSKEEETAQAAQETRQHVTQRVLW